MKSNTPVLKNIPNHIAFIMDGNGRWAKKRLLPRSAGHKKGVETLKKVVSACMEIGINCITVYAWSTENQKRPSDEKNALFGLIEDYFNTTFDDFIKNEIKVQFIGDISYFPEYLQKIFENAAQKSSHFTKKVLNIALNYGARSEIVRAVNTLVEKGEKVDEAAFLDYLYTKGLPPLDLIVRTGGEFRLSNFLLYQAAYSELYFSKTLWPDFNKSELHKILQDYSSRERRYGNV